MFYKNIIFDLGGVIINLDTHLTLEAFKKCSNLNAEACEKQFITNPVFNEYEQGHISDNDFRDHVRQIIKNNISEHEFDSAWNAMILELPAERLALLEELRSKGVSLFLLSNTNNIHLQRVFQTIKQTGDKPLEAYFDKCYYSHLIKARKPDKESFECILNDNNIKPEETLFLDDNKDNLNGAKKLGIHTRWVDDADRLKELVYAR